MWRNYKFSELGRFSTTKDKDTSFKNPKDNLDKMQIALLFILVSCNNKDMFLWVEKEVTGIIYGV